MNPFKSFCKYFLNKTGDLWRNFGSAEMNPIRQEARTCRP